MVRDFKPSSGYQIKVPNHTLGFKLVLEASFPASLNLMSIRSVFFHVHRQEIVIARTHAHTSLEKQRWVSLKSDNVQVALPCKVTRPPLLPPPPLFTHWGEAGRAPVRVGALFHIWTHFERGWDECLGKVMSRIGSTARCKAGPQFVAYTLGVCMQ